MATDFKNLDKVILGWERNFEKTSLAARKKSGAAFLVSVVDGTPQDTGETVSNWQVGRGDIPPSGMLPPFIPGTLGSARSGNQTATKAVGRNEIRKLRRIESLYIVNNSVVMGFLEAGLSAQAPRGNIVAKAVAIALLEYRGIDSWLDGTSNNIDSGV